MYHAKPNTLSYHKARPLFHKQAKVYNTNTRAVVGGLNQYFKTNPGCVSVEEHAIRFYFLNHVFSLIQQKFDPAEPLPKEANALAQAYIDLASLDGIRVFYYTLLATTRETRHLKDPSTIGPEVTKKYGSAYMKLRNSLPGGSEQAALHFRNNPPDMPIGHYCAAMTYVFNNGSFSGGYGGKPWGNIANNALRLTSGEISMEGFIDTAWTLAHNNGPMFNKGMLYNHYNEYLYKILDVQAAGMIPQMLAEVANGKYSISGVTHLILQMWKEAQALLGSAVEGYVDWGVVEQHGKKKYPDEKKLQAKWYGKVAAAAPPPPTDKFYISNGEYVTVIKTKRAA